MIHNDFWVSGNIDLHSFYNFRPEYHNTHAFIQYLESHNISYCKHAKVNID